MTQVYLLKAVKKLFLKIILKIKILLKLNLFRTLASIYCDILLIKSWEIVIIVDDHDAPRPNPHISIRLPVPSFYPE